jgi:DNA-binding MarR family transcriptional regulator
MLKLSMTMTDPLDTFFDSFDAFGRAVRRARGVRSASDPDALTLSQYGLLEPLLKRDGAGVQELAAQAGITAPTATRILDTLERRGLVTRERVEHDRRAVVVAPTRSGRATLQARYEWLHGLERALFESLSNGERELAPGLLARLATLVDELAAGPAGRD